MTPSLQLFLAMFTTIIAERLIELRIAHNNTKRLLNLGAKEFGRDHYGYLVSLHSLFFVSLLIEGLFTSVQLAPHWMAFLVFFLLAQIGRVWVIRSMEGRWTTRIIVLSGAPLIERGPFRFLNHPNYVVVAIELFSFPMIFSLYWTALVFSCLNAALLLFIRIPNEERALG